MKFNITIQHFYFCDCDCDCYEIIEIYWDQILIYGYENIVNIDLLYGLYC